ncbi:hypothetical protein KY290_021026 [Solanum tuberosum]|uniref:Uncharacterized protein n=1 Tax=Solanum tuberosum TaxID=4113 RepID=A0ABQ7V0C4_SOLTU|nr:hypothetical protein KY289_020209 [Solanum tuberosum]KAH0692875.1 hypothetical protein KY285_019972 [Solanum tuberosum]KAH0757533.1 hypothetical protein KY290_021026 [Solanum tuberosum]
MEAAPIGMEATLIGMETARPPAAERDQQLRATFLYLCSCARPSSAAAMVAWRGAGRGWWRGAGRGGWGWAPMGWVGGGAGVRSE